MKRVINWLPVALGFALMMTLVVPQWQRMARGQNDFVGPYLGGTLVGTPDLYSRPANEALIRSLLGADMESAMYTRPPFYAVLCKPLAWFPYRVAYGIFFLCCLFSIAWFLWRFSTECPALPLYAAFSVPLAAMLPQGQDTWLLLVFGALSILLSREKKDFPAGLVLSLCAIKFHLVLLIPLMLLVKRRWRILGGAATGTGVLVLIGVLFAGPDSTRQYIHVLRDPYINFRGDMMPNLHGLVTTLQAGSGVEMGLVCTVLLLFAWICRRTDDYELLFGISILGGLLISYHSGLGDHILLLLAFVLIVNSSAEKSLRIAIASALTPIPYFTGITPGIVVPILLLAVLAVAAASVTWRRGQIPHSIPALT